MKHFLLFIGLLASVYGKSQNQHCGGNRFFNNLYPTIKATFDVKYGENITVNGNTLDLLADVYEPENDTATQRPLLIFMHGGSFVSGDKSDLQSFCEYYAEKGFVVASISYRLFDKPLFPLPDSNDIAEVVVQSMGDLKAAVRFFKDDAIQSNQFGIDTNYVIVGGISAGAIAALHSTYVDPSDNPSNFLMQYINVHGGWEGNSNAISGVSSQVRGVINFSGALYQTSYMNGGDVPVYSVHDEFDPVVPYKDDFVSLSGISLLQVQGSYSIHQRAQQEGITTDLVTIDGSTAHVGYFADPNQAIGISNGAAYFVVNKIVCPGMEPNGVTPVHVDAEFTMAPNPASSQVVISSSSPVTKVVVHTLAGKQIKEQLGGTMPLVMDVSQLPQGMYLLHVLGADNTDLGVRKLVVK